MGDLNELKRALGEPAHFVVPSYRSWKHQTLAVLVEAALDAQEPERAAAIALLQKAVDTEKFQDVLRFRDRRPLALSLPSRLAEFLDSSDRVLRILGASFIRAVWMPEALPGLLRGLCDDDMQVRETCLAALSGNRSFWKLDPSRGRELLSSERPEVRYVALRLLAFLQENSLSERQPCAFQEELHRVFVASAATAPVRACAAALLDSTPELPGQWEATLNAVRTESDKYIRRHAMVRLGRWHQQQAEQISELIQVISEALKRNPESDGSVAINVLEGLVPTHDAAIEALIDAFRFISEHQGIESPQQYVIRALHRLEKQPERVIPRLRAALENPEFIGGARGGVVRALTCFPFEGGIPHESFATFLKALWDPSGRVVEEAAHSLMIGYKEPLAPRLLMMLEAPTLRVIGRCGVALVLGHFGERAAIPHLAFLLEQEDQMFPMHEMGYAPPGSCIGHPVKVPLMKRDAAYRLIPFGRLALEALPALLENLLAKPGPLKEAVSDALSALQPTRDELEAAAPRLREKLLRGWLRSGRSLEEGVRERVESHLQELIEEVLTGGKGRTGAGW